MNVALPRIGSDLPASFIGVLEGQTYIVSGYLAVLAALLILAGALSDHYGRRRVFGIGLTGFGVTSVVCGLAPTLELLVIARLFQGAAGALLVPGSLAIITNAFDGPQRARAFGIWAAATSALTVLGPIVGGAPRRFGRLARRVPHQRAAHPRRLVRAAPRRGVARHVAATGGSTGSARSSPRSRSADSPSA